jgi:tetratricopeptide (TPR) repeat protein
MASHKKKMPQRVQQHVTGDKGISYLSSFITEIGWTIEEAGKDYGIDTKIETFADGEALAFIFYAQSKATEVTLSGKKSVYKNFKESVFNYLVELNVPVLVTYFFQEDKKMFYRWVINASSFIKSGNSHKLMFNELDYLNFESKEDFINSTMAVRSIQKFNKGDSIEIEILGKVKDRIAASKLVELYSDYFGGKIKIVHESAIKLVFENSSIKFKIPGVIHFFREYSDHNFINCIIDLIQFISGFIDKSEAMYTSQLLKIHFQENFDVENLLFANHVFDNKFNHEKLIDFIQNDFETNEKKMLSHCVSILQLRYFDLSSASRRRLIELIKLFYEQEKDEKALYNYLLILQAENSSGIDEIVSKFNFDSEEIRYSDQLLIEVANAYLKILRPDKSIDFLNRVINSDAEEVIYLRGLANLRLGNYKIAFKEYERLAEVSRKPFSNLVLRTCLALISDGFKIKEQKLDFFKQRAELIPISSAREAIEYLVSVDATHPHIWYILGTESLEEFSTLNEPEFYAAFSAILGHGSLTYKLSITKLVERIYYGPKHDKDIFQAVLVNIIEEAIRIRGWDFTVEIVSWLSEIEADEAVIESVYNSALRIRNYHLKKSAENLLTVTSDGYIGNSLYRDSILDANDFEI